MYNGKLIYIGEDSFPFPNDYIYKGSYRTGTKTQDVNSKLQNNYVLRRNVAEHTRATIDFSLPSGMTNEVFPDIYKMFEDRFIVLKEKDVMITYYVPEHDRYRTGRFYMADPEFVIDHTDDVRNIVTYAAVNFSFVEY